MQLKLFSMISTLVGIGSVLGDESSSCSTGPQGNYNMAACLVCATSGKGTGQCCSSIYHHAVRRDAEDEDEDDAILRNITADGDCTDRGVDCDVGQGQCLPGLICTHHHYPYEIDSSTCEYYSNGHGAVSSTVSVSALQSGSLNCIAPLYWWPDVVLVVFVTLGLLGAAIVVLTITVKVNLMRD